MSPSPSRRDVNGYVVREAAAVPLTTEQIAAHWLAGFGRQSYFAREIAAT